MSNMKRKGKPREFFGHREKPIAKTNNTKKQYVILECGNGSTEISSPENIPALNKAHINLENCSIMDGEGSHDPVPEIRM